MPTNLNLPEADIRKLLDEYLKSGCTLNEFCTIEGHNETVLQEWLEKYYPEQFDDGFMEAQLNTNIKEEPKKSAVKKQFSQMLFAKVGDIELYHQVSASYLKSLKG